MIVITDPATPIDTEAQGFIADLTAPDSHPLPVERVDHFITQDQVLSLLPESAVESLTLAELGRSPVSTLVCGHAPHLDRLIARVLNTPAEVTELKKGGTACLELPGGPASPGILHWLLPPRALRRLGRA